MGPVFKLSMHQLARRRRFLILLLLAILPVALAAIISALGGDGEADKEGFINGLLDAMIVAAIMPITTIALATTAFGDELESRTLSYLVLKPMPRWKIVLPKFLASIVVCGPLLIASGVAVTLIGLDGSVQAAVAVGAAIFFGVIAYAAIFMWAGLVSTHALSYGLIYVFLWEGVLSSYLDSIHYLSVRGYTLAIMHGIGGDSFKTLGDRVIEFPAGIIGAIIIAVVFFLLTVRRLNRMDVP